MKQNKQMAIAITGNIGSGKTTVCSYLEAMGYKVQSVDDMAHEALEEPQLIWDLCDYFGDEIITDGKIDREKLGEMVFEDENKLSVLNKMIHPVLIERLIEEVNKVDKIGFFEVPLLFEAGLEELFDLIILISANTRVRLARIMTREGMTLNKAKAINKSQMPDRDKKADIVIFNNEDDGEGLSYEVIDVIRYVEGNHKEVKNEK